MPAPFPGGSKVRPLILACAASLLLSVPAAAQDTPSEPADTPGPDCFRAGQVGGWGIIDGRTIRVRINSSRQYALRTVGSARALRWEMGIALSSFSGWICVGHVQDVYIHRVGQMPRSWLVESVEALSDATSGEATAQANAAP
jgi:hypothetical protein